MLLIGQSLLSSTLPQAFPGRLSSVIPQLEHTLRSPFLRMGTTTLVFCSVPTVSDLHKTLKRCVKKVSPAKSRPASTSGSLLLRSSLTTSETSARDMGESSDLLHRGCAGRIQDFLKVLYPPLNNIPVRVIRSPPLLKRA